MRYLLNLSYDGTNFCGWQIQKSGRTVQSDLETALFSVFKKKINLTGSGRTDSGVHAICQYAHFDIETGMTTNQIKLALQTKLDRDIKINNVYMVNKNFHARFDAIERCYKYYISKIRSPFNRFYSASFPRMRLNKTIMELCLPYFIGSHDFSAFSRPNPDLKHYICHINYLKLEETEDQLIFEISANRFLHNMVRRIVGTILNISSKSLNPEIIEDLFKLRKTDQKFIFTAPPEGLFLIRVRYPVIPRIN